MKAKARITPQSIAKTWLSNFKSFNCINVYLHKIQTNKSVALTVVVGCVVCVCVQGVGLQLIWLHRLFAVSGSYSNELLRNTRRRWRVRWRVR